ncbi:hypothetical protein Enr17x_32590 [Gimesia fumaroli]|uniref:Uncharacterized protein n=1 Tax=Gimesia fumaroli TaxID=2527976 RepID=A0A518IDR5_9PLAN|nr:hypothetical protein Enr17x_32590 [Gimesia fumaroli]
MAFIFILFDIQFYSLRLNTSHICLEFITGSTIKIELPGT